MKLTQVKNMIVLAMLSAGYVSAANAAPQNAVTATANATFSNPSTITLTVTPESDLVAGSIPSKTLVANAEADDTISSIISYRWTPGSGDIHASGPKNIQNVITITGTNASNKIKLTLNPERGGAQGYVKDGGDGWIIPTNPVTSLPLVIQTLDDQTINADTYTLSIDAAEWVS